MLNEELTTEAWLKKCVQVKDLLSHTYYQDNGSEMCFQQQILNTSVQKRTTVCLPGV